VFGKTAFDKYLFDKYSFNLAKKKIFKTKPSDSCLILICKSGSSMGVLRIGFEIEKLKR
jgi:hypothetical protein